MFEPEFFQIETIYKGVDEPDGFFFGNVFVDGVWEEHCLASVSARNVFAHGFSTALSVAVKLV